MDPSITVTMRAGSGGCNSLHFVAGAWRGDGDGMTYLVPSQPWETMMRKTILVAVTAFAIGGATTGALLATAQPAPPPDAAAGAPPAHGPMMGWMQRMHGHHPFRPEMFALVYRQA